MAELETPLERRYMLQPEGVLMLPLLFIYLFVFVYFFCPGPIIDMYLHRLLKVE